MTKVEAIEQLMRDNGGTATLKDIYDSITKYYPTAKNAKEWEAGLRGVLYREVRNNRRFKKIGLSIYALSDYTEAPKPSLKDAVRMHSFIEGICVELGNMNDYKTYTADASMVYRENLKLSSFTTLEEFPKFSYDDVVNEAKRIDVIWFNNSGLLFPQRVFEVVDSISTLDGAFNRSLQLKNFRTEFYIVAPEKHRAKFNHTIQLERYNPNMDRFSFISYDEIMELYDNVARAKKIEKKIFG